MINLQYFRMPEDDALVDQMPSSSSSPKEVKNKRFKCPVCGKCFAENFNMKVHLRVHTKDKPFSCKLCPKS
jgi:uncharacterized Zn-finger protein